MTENDFEGDMEQLAADIAVAAGGGEVALHDKIDAFKALMPYLVMLKKHKVPDETSDENVFDFTQAQRKITAVE